MPIKTPYSNTHSIGFGNKSALLCSAASDGWQTVTDSFPSLIHRKLEYTLSLPGGRGHRPLMPSTSVQTKRHELAKSEMDRLRLTTACRSIQVFILALSVSFDELWDEEDTRVISKLQLTETMNAPRDPKAMAVLVNCDASRQDTHPELLVLEDVISDSMSGVRPWGHLKGGLDICEWAEEILNRRRGSWL